MAWKKECSPTIIDRLIEEKAVVFRILFDCSQSCRKLPSDAQLKAHGELKPGTKKDIPVWQGMLLPFDVFLFSESYTGESVDGHSVDSGAESESIASGTIVSESADDTGESEDGGSKPATRLRTQPTVPNTSTKRRSRLPKLSNIKKAFRSIKSKTGKSKYGRDDKAFMEYEKKGWFRRCCFVT